MDGKQQQQPAAILVACLVLFTSINSSDAGGGGCSLSTIVVTQSGTGKWAHGMPVYSATVRNTCRCAQSDVKVDCKGFNTTLSVDPAKLKEIGGGVCPHQRRRPACAGAGRHLQLRLEQPVRVPAGLVHRDVLGPPPMDRLEMFCMAFYIVSVGINGRAMLLCGARDTNDF